MGSTNWTVRTRASLSAIRACNGMCSQMSNPGTLVLIGLNSPRNSDGAAGLRSYMSMCEGPPARQIMITERGFKELPVSARSRSTWGKVKPPSPSAPTFKKSRRFMPSQKRRGIPKTSAWRFSLAQGLALKPAGLVPASDSMASIHGRELRVRFNPVVESGVPGFIPRVKGG